MSVATGLLVGLDIGGAKVATVVGEFCPGGALRVVGGGSALCEGLQKGVVVNPEAVVHAIVSAVKEAEVSAGCEIRTVIGSVSSPHVKAFNSHAAVPIKSGAVKPADVRRVLDAAGAVALPHDRDVLHVLPQEFSVDGCGGIEEPLGMVGARLEARAHVVTTLIQAEQDVARCCQQAGLHVADLVVAPLASGEAVLTEEDTARGCVLVEIGAGTTGVVAFREGRVCDTVVIPIGGNHVSNDLAAGLQTPFREAERLKRRFGSAATHAGVPDFPIEVPAAGGDGERQLSRRVLTSIIEPRVAEIFTLVRRLMERHGVAEALAAGAVLAGGSVVIDGLVSVAERVFETRVRVGRPVDCEGWDPTMTGPAYAAAVGLLRYAGRSKQQGLGTAEDERLLGRTRRRMVGWLRARV